VLIERPPALAVLPVGYGPLFDRAVAVFAADERVRALWVHGALARGAADAGSDLDLSVAVADDDFGAFASEWQTWLAAVTPTLTACERIDVFSEPVSQLLGTALTRRLVVFDRDDLNGLIPTPHDPPPDAGKISFLIEETLRQAANFPVVEVRGDWLLGVVAVQQVQLFLYELFAEANKPMPSMGPKQWSTKLTPRQQGQLEALPAAAPTQESVQAARRAVFTLFFTEAPAIARASGVTWPAELETAVRAYLSREQLPLPDPAGS
jgi:hypothetical protein